MIIVILAVGILMVICGSILYSKLESDKDDIAAAFQIIGVIVIISSFIAFVSLLKCVLDRVGIDEKIAMYEEENTKRSNHIVYLKGDGHTISEWAEILGIGKTTIRMRLKSGWSDEDALTVQIRKRTRGYRPSVLCGEKMD